MKKLLLIFFIVVVCNNTFSQITWQQTSGPNVGAINGICINSSGAIFVATDYNGVRLSTNNGNSWNSSISGLTNTYIKSITVGLNNYVYAGTAILVNGSNGIFRSTNNGSSWNYQSYGIPSNTGIYCFAVNKNNGKVFAGAFGVSSSNQGIYMSADNGSSWSQIYNTGANSISINSSGKLLAGTQIGVYLSTNDGNDWSAINNGLPNSNIKSVISTDNGIFIAGVQNGGLYISTNNGSLWNQILNGISNTENISSFSVNNLNHIFASSTSNGVYRSIDNGNSWISINDGLSSLSVSSLYLNGSQYLFSGCSSGYVYKTTSSTIGIKNISSDIPDKYLLSQNYPNPFNPTTNIKFDLSKNSFVKLKIFDILGKEVETLVDKKLDAGSYSVDWNASQYPSGIYFYRLQTDDYNETIRMALIK
jgi:photosystem II stability/assembly factor-like uncharacterized protein